MNAQLSFPDPLARHTDPPTSREAAKKMESGNGPMMAAIRSVYAALPLPMSAFACADYVRAIHRDSTGKPRWKHDSLRSAVSRAPFLRWVDNKGRVPDTGNACRRYVLKEGA